MQIPFGGQALPNPLGELKRSPDLIAKTRGPILVRVGMEWGREGRGEGREGKEGSLTCLHDAPARGWAPNVVVGPAAVVMPPWPIIVVTYGPHSANLSNLPTYC